MRLSELRTGEKGVIDVYKRQIEELIAVQTDYNEKLNAITSFDDRIAELTAQKETLDDKGIKQAAVLTKLRSQSGKNIEKQMQSLLVPLGMSNVRFVVELNPRKEPDSKGMDSAPWKSRPWQEPPYSCSRGY